MGSQGRRQVEGLFDQAPMRRPASAVGGDPGRHLTIAGGGGGEVSDRQPAVPCQPLRHLALAGANAAQD